MLSKATSTTYFLLSILMALVLSSGFARADISSNQDHVATNAETHLNYCNLPDESTTKVEFGCSDLCGSCFEKQCCSHGHASGNAVVETQQRSYNAPFRYELVTSRAIHYTSADSRSLYRPPIA
ncbi:MAG: hypothetical protein HWE19_17010 [Vibrionaceae bacterium]|nr:hypothetical protein [Vibrionaceae bacterium]